MFHHMTCQGWRWGCPTHKFRPPILSTMHSSVIASYKLLDPITKRKRGHPYYWQMPQHPPISTTQAQTLRLSNPTFHTVSGFLVLTAGQNTVWTSLEISWVLSVKTRRIRFHCTKWSCAILRHSAMACVFLFWVLRWRHDPGHFFSVFGMTQNNFSILQGCSLLKPNVLTFGEQLFPFTLSRRSLSAVVKSRHLPSLKIVNSSGYTFACRWFLFQALSHHRCACKWSRSVLYEWAQRVERQIWNRYHTLTEAKDNNDQSQQYAHNGKSGTTKLFSQNTRISGWSCSVWGEHLSV